VSQGKVGAEGLRIVAGRWLHLELVNRGDYQVWSRERAGGLGPRLGRATRERHTYRVPYFPGSRVGHDRTHWCWHAQPASGGAGSWCHTTLQAALEALL
jgi:hypothetical protein